MTIQAQKGILLAPPACSAMLKRGMERIEKKSPRPVDVLYGREPDEPVLSEYDWILLLDKITIAVGDSLQDDAWGVTVEGDCPARVTIEAQTERARLYALYHIAACLEIGTPVSDWPVKRTPLLKKRYAWISAGNCWSDVARPDWFDRDIEDIPGLGLNGVLLTLTPTHGTSIGRQTLPLTLTEDGVSVDRFKLPAFVQMFDRLKTYGLDIGILHQAFIPPRFTIEQVRSHYDGKTVLDGLEEAIEESSHDLAAAIFTHMPQVDSLLFHSLECEWMWGNAVSMFPRKDDNACGRAFEAYLKGQLRACEARGKTLMFWTHVSGIPARQIRLMHEILERYPDVVVIEDHKWPNSTWPHSPVMGHVADDILERVTARRWGMSIVTTDGEFYGAGAMPTAYPEPNVLSAKTAVERDAECAFIRFNEQALTPLRTLEDVNGIHLVASSEVWWKPARKIDELWTDWCSRRFGADAASAVASALKKSETIITKGFSAGEQPLMDHSALLVGSWKPGVKYRAWDLFARAGELMVDKPWDELDCPEMRPWQVNARGVALDDFLRDSSEAEVAARKGLKEIESVRTDLTDDDYNYLTTCFEDAILMMEAIRLTAAGARASALYMETSNENPHRLDEACKAMESCADRIESERGSDFRAAHHFFSTTLNGRLYDAYGLPIGLRSIAEQYRNCLK